MTGHTIEHDEDMIRGLAKALNLRPCRLGRPPRGQAFDSLSGRYESSGREYGRTFLLESPVSTLPEERECRDEKQNGPAGDNKVPAIHRERGDDDNRKAQ